MNLKEVLIKTEHLILKPIEMEYDEVIFNEFTDEISKYRIPKPEDTIDGIHNFINESIKGLNSGSNLQLIAIEKNSVEFIGCVGLHNINTINPEIGIWLKKSAHGKSYGLEAVTKLIHWAKDNLDFEYLIYPVDRRNLASRRIPVRNNGIIKKEYKELNQKGFELDTIEHWIY